MTISQAISVLQRILQKHGDIELTRQDGSPLTRFTGEDVTGNPVAYEYPEKTVIVDDLSEDTLP